MPQAGRRPSVPMGAHKQKERAWPHVLNAVRSGMGFTEAIKDTRWRLVDWRRWMTTSDKHGEERMEQLREAENEGRATSLEVLRDRAFSLYSAWMTRLEDKMNDPDGGPLTKTDVEQLRSMVEGRLPDLREKRVAPEKITSSSSYGFDD